MTNKSNTTRNLCLRRIRKFKYRWLILVILLFSLVIISQQKLFLYPLFNGRSSLCEPIDVVYTWVNGSDLHFKDTIRKYDPEYEINRFDDKNELRYSLRSLEKYASWIRHVYIVTNGQIPNWLDLSNDRVTIVPHEIISPKVEWLPTYSSAAIETFLHRIPNLSRRFLYLNDDIFLNAPLYPEDLYTDSEGVRIYQAWLVPDCADNCPWTYIGDGACDRHCNIVECQFDGGDCFQDNGIMINDSKEKPSYSSTIRNNDQLFVSPSIERLTGGSSFKEFVMHSTNLRTNDSNKIQSQDFRLAVNSFNTKQMHFSASLRRKKYSSFRSRDDTSVTSTSTLKTTRNKSLNRTLVESHDIFSQSLIFTNMLFNRVYGFKPRRILAHVGFLLDRTIIEQMQQKFTRETEETLRQRFRTGNDLQFAFAYYSFIMEETRRLSVPEIFQEFDTDNSRTWSDREIRTLLTRLFPLPLSLSALRFLEDVINNCSRSSSSEENTRSSTRNTMYTTLIYERYMDSNLPTVTEKLVEECEPLHEALQENFSLRPKYRFHVNPRNSVHNNFMMLTSNLSEVAEGLDKLRKNPRKFNCINDNLQPGQEDNALIHQLLEDFYLSFFPQRSQFELPATYRNRFDHWRDYQRWRRRKRAALIITYGVSVILVAILFKFICKHKAKMIRRCVQSL